jgi:outer membrane protein OmpA-like peptidoglycan-associated protein
MHCRISCIPVFLITTITVQAQDLRLPFSLNSYSVDEHAWQLIAKNCACEPGTIWEIEGRAGSSGSESYNLDLSRRRAESVRDLLISKGCSSSQINLYFVGEKNAFPKQEKPEDRVVILRKKIQTPITELKSTAEANRPIHIRVFDRISRLPLKASAKMADFPTAVSISKEGTKIIPIMKTVLISSPGYRDSTIQLNKEEETYAVFLLPEEVDELIVSEHIYFFPNTPEIVPESFRTLDYIYKTLENKRTKRIEVHGHVNWPVYNMSTEQRDAENQQLSEARANAVKRELIRRGFPEENIQTKGYGNTRMLFPEAISEGEQAQNRRVEMLIMAPR